jgi:hypothetical protein
MKHCTDQTTDATVPKGCIRITMTAIEALAVADIVGRRAEDLTYRDNQGDSDTDEDVEDLMECRQAKWAADRMRGAVRDLVESEERDA